MENNGISLSSLAERLRAKTEKDAQEIESLTRKQFDSLSKSLAESSQNALSITEKGILKNLLELEQTINSHCRILSGAFGWKCLQAATLTFIILLAAGLSGWGLLSLFRHQATNLRQEIVEIQNRKDALEARSARIWATFKGLEPYPSEGKDYLLTPEGWTINPAGTLGKRDAWIIVRK
jgi:hypothetical protein